MRNRIIAGMTAVGLGLLAALTLATAPAHATTQHADCQLFVKPEASKLALVETVKNPCRKVSFEATCAGTTITLGNTVVGEFQRDAFYKVNGGATITVAPGETATLKVAGDGDVQVSSLFNFGPEGTWLNVEDGFNEYDRPLGCWEAVAKSDCNGTFTVTTHNTGVTAAGARIKVDNADPVLVEVAAGASISTAYDSGQVVSVIVDEDKVFGPFKFAAPTCSTPSPSTAPTSAPPTSGTVVVVGNPGGGGELVVTGESLTMPIVAASLLGVAAVGLLIVSLMRRKRLRGTLS